MTHTPQHPQRNELREQGQTFLAARQAYNDHNDNYLFRATFEHAPVGITHSDLEGKLIQVNQKVCDILGYSREELFSLSHRDITYEEEIEDQKENFRRLAAGEVENITFEQRYYHKNGELIWVQLTVSLLRDEEGQPLYYNTVIENIEERKTLEAIISQQKQSLLQIARNAKYEQRRLTFAQRAGQIGTFDWDIVTNQIAWTPELEALYGLPTGGFEGRYENWMSLVHPDDLAQVEESLQSAAQGGSPCNTEFRIQLPDGTERWMLAKGEVVAYDEVNVPTRIIGINMDITERKEAERQKELINEQLEELNNNLEQMVEQRTHVLQQLNTELQRSNQELQDFAYVASHDLQEPLRKIQAFGNLLEEEYGEEISDGKAYLDRMRGAASRMRVLIDDLLAFSRVTTKAEPFVLVDLNNVMEQVVDDLETRLQDTHGTIEISTMPNVMADRRQMYQLFLNLLMNAIKFQQPGIAPAIKVTAQESEQNCQIFVQDNGIGFDEKYLDRIFTVFQRLHGRNEYEGTGIGLAVVRKIVERHHGSITARSTIGVGSTFIITLPQSKQAIATDTIS